MFLWKKNKMMYREVLFYSKIDILMYKNDI